MTARTDGSSASPPSGYAALLFSRDVDKDSILYRMPLGIAMLSVAFEYVIDVPEDVWIIAPSELDQTRTLFAFFRSGLICCAAVLSLFSKTSRLGIVLFAVTAGSDFIFNWLGAANHRWLAMWTIPIAVIFSQWWRSDLYSLYLRVTLGVVMIAACAQKIVAGSYIDGSYLYYLSGYGSPTERLFSFACDMSAGAPCLMHKLIGRFILVWQFAVGVLLLLGVKSLLFLSIEVGFLLGAGFYADEMNFQVLNIALLCIVFRVGMPIWLLVICLLLLVIDVFSIGELYVTAIQYVF